MIGLIAPWRRQSVGVFLFGFALATAYCPWITGAAATPRWCVLVIGAIVILGMSLFTASNEGAKRDMPCLAVVFGSIFLGWAWLSMAWSPAFEAKDQAWKLALYAALFMAGGQLSNLRPFYVGAAVGLAISGALVIADLAGLISYQQVSRPSGLFVNGLYLAEFSALIIVALMAEGLPMLAMLCVPALALGSVARGPILALGVAGFVAVMRGPRRVALIAMLAALIAILLMIAWRPATVWARIDLWLALLPHLTLSGHGLGAFFGDGPLMVVYEDYLRDGRPPHANNDLLEIAYDLGAVGVITAVGFVASLLRGPLTAERLVILVFVIEGCFGFPFYLPWSAGLFMLAAGHSARKGN